MSSKVDKTRTPSGRISSCLARLGCVRNAARPTKEKTDQCSALVTTPLSNVERLPGDQPGPRAPLQRPTTPGPSQRTRLRLLPTATAFWWRGGNYVPRSPPDRRLGNRRRRPDGPYLAGAHPAGRQRRGRGPRQGRRDPRTAGQQDRACAGGEDAARPGRLDQGEDRRSVAPL